MSVISVSTSTPLSVLYFRSNDSRFPSFFESSRSSLAALLRALGLEPPLQWGGTATYLEHVAVIDQSSVGRKAMLLGSIVAINDISGHCMSASCQHYMSLDVDEAEPIRVRMKASEIVKVLRWLGHAIPSHFGGTGSDKYRLDGCDPIQRTSPLHAMMSEDQKKLILSNVSDVHDFYIDPTCKSNAHRRGSCSHYCQVMNEGAWSSWMLLSAQDIRRVSSSLGKNLPAHFQRSANSGLVKTSASMSSMTLRERRSMGALHIDT